MPVLVANGDNDLLIPTENSIELFKLLPHAYLHLYPDSGHGFLYQYAELFANHVHLFLKGEDANFEEEPGRKERAGLA
jgi:pimeloyl-ACP methyl ester carboxylesterase